MSYELKGSTYHNNLGKELFEELFTKEARVFGESAPELVNSEHAGIPYKTRKRAYMRYAKVKAQEPKTGWGTALATGGVIGGVLGGVGSGTGAGALGGAALGGMVGAVMKAADDVEINEAQQVIRNPKSKHVADEVMAHRMARHARMEREQDRAERRANSYMLAKAVSRPRTVNNYRTRVNAISVRNNVRNTNTANIVKVGSAAVGALGGAAIGGGLGFSYDKKNRLRNTLLGAGAGAAVGAGIGFRPSIAGGGGGGGSRTLTNTGRNSSGFKIHEGKNRLLLRDNGEVWASTRSASGKTENVRKVHGVSDEVKNYLKNTKGGMIEYTAGKTVNAPNLDFILKGKKV